ncbi:MAG TPA: hypothetical protein VGO73_01575, partial [Pyrinomonadaceae bacterium]|nr:hypothetical protein [Pyrinomonadaceae bacterium]
PRKSQYEVWEVQGQLKTDRGGSVEKKTVLSLLPPNINVRPDGRFSVLIATMPGINGGLKFPQLHIEHPDYQTVDIDLNETEPGYGQEKCHISKSDRNKELKLDNLVVLKRKESDYDPSGQNSQVPSPVSLLESEVKP